MQDLEDKELILHLQEGSLEALGHLYDRHQELVFRTARAIVGDSEGAGDVLQEVFLRLHRFSHRVDPSRPMEPWLYRVTVNQACTWVKRRRWTWPIDELADWLSGDRSQTPTHVIERRESWDAVERAIWTLPLAQRTVIVLYYINDLSLQEIAGIIGVPTGTVKSRLHYGRRAMRKAMEAEENYRIESAYEYT
ncbi:MAG: RNA polymerase sigma factor [Anaerolineales bacterium]|nr:RNA polymerase sigma factor [Anaerolineales bacterium]